MPIKLSAKDRLAGATDPKKESIIKELSLIFNRLGYLVRRERLKQGHGWRVVSGACRAHDFRYIFVDRKLSQSDQVSFLLSKLAGAVESVPSSALEGISPATAELVRGLDPRHMPAAQEMVIE